MDGNVDNHWLEENIHHGFEFFEPMGDTLLEDGQMAIPDHSEEWYHDRGHHELLQTRRCMSGVLESLLPFMMWSIGLSVVQRMIWRTDMYVYFLYREHLRDCLVSALGLFLLWSNASIYQPYAFVIYFWISFSALFLLNRSPNKGHYVSAVTFVYVVLTQIYFEDVQFTAFRGSLMIVSMKMISLAYDTKEISMMEMPSIMAYLFNPSTLLFGPFNTIEQYRHAKRRCQKFCIKSFLLHFVTCLKYLAFAILFVTYSSCIVDQIPTFFNEPKLGHYTTAQAFRSSQYFVGYFSLFTALIGGFGENDVHTTHWTSVEWPRSLTEVVVHWNLPMHGFLHKYIYQKTRLNFGQFSAMLSTFLASSLLHGFNFQLTAVLLSLGFYAYVESSLRKHLASKLSACVESRNCDPQCAHRHRKWSFLSVTVNLVFVFLNIFHLAYLGAPFQQIEAQRYGYSWKHTLSVWEKDWQYSSHILSIILLFLSIILSF